MFTYYEINEIQVLDIHTVLVVPLVIGG